MASGALVYTIRLEPGQNREVAVVLPQTGGWAPQALDVAKAQAQVAGNGGRSWAWFRCRCLLQASHWSTPCARRWRTC